MKLLILGATFFALYTIQKYIEVRRVIKSVHSHPGTRTIFSLRSLIGNILPRIPGVSRGINANWVGKHKPYAEAGWDVLANVTFVPSAAVTLSLADAAAIKEITTARARFPKPIKQYKLVSFFGDNIIASEGEEWKRYRKIAAPAFNDRNNKLIWDETLRIMLDLFDNVWGSQDTIVVEHGISLTQPVTEYLGAIAAIPPGHRMAFKDALNEVSQGCLTKFLVPSWAMGLHEHTRTVRLAFEELEIHMLEMISKRRNEGKKEERYDLLSSLLDASIEDPTFTDRDLMGNIFIFLVAGHETTAHTLCFTFALLALYPEEQEILFQHIKSVLSDGRLPVNSIPKYSIEDTTLTISNGAGDKRIIPVPKDAHIVINAVGLHYNPRYWKDPEEFRPARFLDPDWPRDAFVPFSAGSFSETEAVAVLTMLVLKYQFEVKEEPQFASESFEERKARVLASKPGLTMSPIRVPLVFRRR
ncbi:cytochrome P450 [Gymnopus androsaceus JB14]|uniref:Cytochrome P450 n=1 Tax=Gymnopus androsaceus JB14 TaxID=1447944 RepID=A0A6A4HGB8_9AGAR|nr:cytochrome P450 [Gymnopus androsaceus JB14]